MLLRVGEKPAWGNSWTGKRLMRFGIIFLCITGFAVLLWPRIHTRHITVQTPTHNITISSDVKCDNLDFDVLGRLDVTKLSDYVRREVVVSSSSVQGMPISQRLHAPLFDTKSLNSNDKMLVEEHLQADCSNPLPLTVQVPTSPKTVDASHIDFGVATTLGRLNESVDQFAHWAGYTRTRIFALIEPDARVSEVRAKADSLGVNLYVTESEEEYQTRYFSLIKHLAENMREQTRWSVVIDDDTFFPSMSKLVTALGEYDHKKPMYIGGLSESVPQIGVFGIMGFGGAGVFLSRPLVNELTKPEVFDACQHMEFTGDRRISLCIYQYTATRLTIDHRMRQLDLMGDVSGFFEAGREMPLSVHHWKSWFHYDMVKVSTISELCGDDCMFRKWYFDDGWVLTNGFSVVKYSTEIDMNDKTMELSWESHNGAVHESFLHELGPLRPKDWDKVSYLLEDSVVDGDRVRQWYINRDPNGDQVLELIWRSG